MSELVPSSTLLTRSQYILRNCPTQSKLQHRVFSPGRRYRPRAHTCHTQSQSSREVSHGHGQKLRQYEDQYHIVENDNIERVFVPLGRTTNVQQKHGHSANLKRSFIFNSLACAANAGGRSTASQKHHARACFQPSCVLVSGSPVISPSTKWHPSGVLDNVVGPLNNAFPSNASCAEMAMGSTSDSLDLLGQPSRYSIACRKLAVDERADAFAIRGGKFAVVFFFAGLYSHLRRIGLDSTDRFAEVNLCSRP